MANRKEKLNENSGNRFVSLTTLWSKIMLVDELIKKLEPFMGKQVIAYGADRGGYDTIIGEPIVKLCSEMEWLQDQEKDCVVVATTPT